MGTTTPSGESPATTLGQEQAALQAQNRLLHAEVVALRQQAHYYRNQHQRAVARAEELQAQVEVLKAKVAELQQRLFGRKSERSNRAPLLGATGQSGARPGPGVSNPAGPAMAARCRWRLPSAKSSWI